MEIAEIQTLNNMKRSKALSVCIYQLEERRKLPVFNVSSWKFQP